VSVLEAIALAALTAVLSSVLTLVLAKLALDDPAAPAVERRLEEASLEIERRVRAGALQAAEEVLPELRRRVQEGFEQGVVALASGSLLERSVTERARSLTGRLDAIFGRKRD
jgi:hypothetical protein